MGRCLDQAAHKIGIIIVVLALQQRANPFQPHASINALHVKGPHRAIGKLFILHEHVVPDFDKPIAILIRASGRATGDVIAMVIKNLCARPARPGWPHPPKIVIRRDADDPMVGQTRHLFPQICGFNIGMINRHAQFILVDAKIAGQQFPAKGDSLCLEIIAETEVSQHFEKRVVARGIADIIQIVVFAASTHTFLRRGGADIIALLQPCEAILELHHSRIREHQRRVVARHKRRTFHVPVPITNKKISKR